MRIITSILILVLMTNVATSYQLPIRSYVSSEPKDIFPTQVRFADRSPTTSLVPRPDMTEPKFQLLKSKWLVHLRRKYSNLSENSRPVSETEWCLFLAEKYGALVEYRLFDNSRVDLLNSKYAIEADWGTKSLKWAEAIGQSLWYSLNTNKKPAIILLVTNKDRTTMSNIYRCRTVCASCGIVLFIEDLTDYTD